MSVQQEICDIGRLIYEKEYVAANDGNITVKMEDGTIWATPAGVSKGAMTPDMLVRVDGQETSWRGRGRCRARYICI